MPGCRSKRTRQARSSLVSGAGPHHPAVAAEAAQPQFYELDRDNFARIKVSISDCS